jgi:glycine cleavage system H protein
MYPEELKYNDNSLWIKVEDGRKIRMGITGFYSERAEKTIFVELPEQGIAIKKGEPIGSLESTSKINDILSPVSGKIVEVNNTVNTDPGITNTDPYGKGWLVEIEIDKPEELLSLMTAQEYSAFVKKKSIDRGDTYPEEIKYTETHLWVRFENGNKVRTGITAFYSEQIQKTIFIDLPEEGIHVKKGEAFGSLESSKTINDLVSPVSGKVIAVNTALNTDPGLTNTDPYGHGWLAVIEMEKPEELTSYMSAKVYTAFVDKILIMRALKPSG